MRSMFAELNAFQNAFSQSNSYHKQSVFRMR